MRGILLAVKGLAVVTAVLAYTLCTGAAFDPLGSTYVIAETWPATQLQVLTYGAIALCLSIFLFWLASQIRPKLKLPEFTGNL